MNKWFTTLCFGLLYSGYCLAWTSADFATIGPRASCELNNNPDGAKYGVKSSDLSPQKILHVNFADFKLAGSSNFCSGGWQGGKYVYPGVPRMNFYLDVSPQPATPGDGMPPLNINKVGAVYIFSSLDGTWQNSVTPPNPATLRPQKDFYVAVVNTFKEVATPDGGYVVRLIDTQRVTGEVRYHYAEQQLSKGCDADGCYLTDASAAYPPTGTYCAMDGLELTGFAFVTGTSDYKSGFERFFNATFYLDKSNPLKLNLDINKPIEVRVGEFGVWGDPGLANEKLYCPKNYPYVD